MKIKSKKTNKILAAVLTGAFILSPLNFTQTALAVENQNFGEIAFRHLEYIEENLHHRVGFTQGEKIMADWIVERLVEIGFPLSDISLQEFTVEGDMADMVRMLVEQDGLEKLSTSQNVILTIPGRSERTIIAGAHYDTVFVAGPGISDNSSGTVLMLEAAERLFGQDLHYTIQFVFFGAEEQGYIGSRYFVNNMTQTEIDNLVLMVNADVIFDAETMFFATGFHDPQTNRTAHNNKSRRVKALAESLNLDFVIAPEGIYVPTDQVPFKEAGFTVAVLYAILMPIPAPADFDLVLDFQDQIDAAADANDAEQLNTILETVRAMNNEILYNTLSTQINVRIDMIENPGPPVQPSEEDDQGYAVQMGLVLHSPNDNLAFLQENHPGLVERALRAYGIFLNEILTLNVHDISGVDRRNEGGIYLLPFRETVNYVGFGNDIVWYGATSQITLNVAGREILLQIGNSSITKTLDGATQTFELPQAPIVINGRTYLTQEFFENVLGVYFEFN
ncbi:MAG: M20/M25/M40 family metallo-hydrolase [Defluviitaleaceae bacterium]|nr:M20/M25/M40 family metallo-hydrolase [Defluviitaleaceae bacterium]